MERQTIGEMNRAAIEDFNAWVKISGEVWLDVEYDNDRDAYRLLGVYHEAPAKLPVVQRMCERLMPSWEQLTFLVAIVALAMVARAVLPGFPTA